jgi:hypothetical protein
MTWIKITHTGGSEYLNISLVYRVVRTTSTQLTVYDASALLPTSYSFSSSVELDQFLLKFESIFKVIDIDALATQG